MENTKTVETLTIDGARLCLDAAVSAAEKLGVGVCIAVVDQAGHLLAFERMDGAGTLSIALSQDKAYTVTSFGVPTAQWYPMIADEPAVLHGIVKADRLMIFGGGVPVIQDGQIVGAVGVSGGVGNQDEQIAAAGAAVI